MPEGDWVPPLSWRSVLSGHLSLGYQEIPYQHWEAPGSDKFIAVRSCLKMTRFSSCKHQLEPAAKGSQEQIVHKALWQL